MVLERPRPGVTLPVADDPAGGVGITLAQISPRLGDVAANLERHLQIIDTASGAGDGLVVFPELSLTGYFLKDLVPEVAVRLDSDTVRTLAAASHSIDVLAGCVIESPEHRFHNAALYCSRGEVISVHRKVYLPTYGLFDEQRYLAAGHRFRSFVAAPRPAGAGTWQAGVLICEDMWHPSAAVLLARQGCDLLLCPSASPGRGVLRGDALGTARSYDAMTRTYAQLFTTYVLYCNRAGFEDGISFWGGSRIVAPDGSVCGEPAGSDEAVIHVRIERSALRRARMAYPLLRDERHDVNDAETTRIRRRHARD